MLDTIAYPEFVPNQILTDGQLNTLRTHLEQEDRLTRLRVAGMGIACGLYARKVSTSVRVDRGFGISSDGHLIELCDTTTFTHFRPYVDPDRDEEQKLKYLAWRTADPKVQKDILELLPAKIDDEAAITASTLTDRVVVLYLEREAVDLNSCLVTSCDNKGRNINVHVRVLLVKKADLATVPGCPAPLPMQRIARLHRKGFPPTSEATLNAKYTALVNDHRAGLSSAIATLFTTYGPLLNLVPVGPDPLAGKLTGGVAQYRYDALLDLATAYNEAAAAAYALIGDCCPTGNFPRHLVLGIPDAPGGGGYRNEFAPGALRNAMHGEIDRVRDLFKRLDAMIFALDLDEDPAMSLRPSHTAAFPLGRRARPFYFAGTGMDVLWRPRPRCTVDGDWPWRHPAVPADFNTDYAESTFFRLEGHVGDGCEAALTAIRTLRDAAHAEFGLLVSYFDDNLAAEQAARAELREALGTIPPSALTMAALLFLNWIEDGEGPVEQISELAKMRHQQIETLMHASETWVDLRETRRLHCDVSGLARDYFDTSNEVLCALNRARAVVRRVLADLEALPDDAITGPGLERMLTGARIALVDRLVTSVMSAPDLWANPADVGARLDPLATVSGAKAMRAAVRIALENLDAQLARVAELALPRELRHYDLDLFAHLYGPVLSYSREVWVWLRVLGIGIPGVIRPLEEGVEPTLHASEIAMLASDWLGLPACSLARFAAVAAAYEEARARDLSLFRNLGQIDGVEHLAGVSKGGTFVLAGTKPVNGTVVADFSLHGCLPCCCEIPIDALCLPPLALPDVRVITTSPEKEDTGKPLTFDINVLANDSELNGRDGTLTARPIFTDTLLGGHVEFHDDGRVTYRSPEAAQPGVVDRFDYELVVKGGPCEERTAVGTVSIIFATEAVLDGRIVGHVRGETGEPIPGVVVKIKDTTRSTVTDAKGEFRFELVPAQDYTLLASAVGMQSQEVAVTVVAGQTANVELILKPPPQTQKGSVIVTAINEEGVELQSFAATLRTQSGTVVDTLITQTGVAHFEALDPGTYKCTVRVGKLAFGVSEDVAVTDQPVDVVVMVSEYETLPVAADTREFVVVTRGLNELEATMALRKVVGTRYANYVDEFQSGADNPAVVTSDAYAIAAKFLTTGLKDPAAPPDAVTADYQHVAEALTAAVADAPEEQKEAYRSALTAVTGAYLDRVALSSPGGLGDAQEEGVRAAAASLEKAGISADRFETTWAGSKLKAATGAESVERIGELLR